TRMSHIPKSFLDGFQTSRRVYYHRGHVAAGDLPEPGRHIFRGYDSMVNSQTFPAKAQSPLIKIERNHFGACQTCELHRAHPDRTCADHEHRLAGLDTGTFNAVRAYCQGFHQRECVGTNATTRHQIGGRYDEIVGHTPIDMHTADPDVHTAICFALATGNAGATAKIRNKGHDLARLKVARAVGFNNLAGQLVAENTRIGEVRLRSLKGMEVGATNTNSPDSQKRFVFTRDRRLTPAVVQRTG